MIEVSNQPPALENYNVYSSDTVLRTAVAREGAGWAEPELDELGETFGRAGTIALGAVANRITPELIAYDRVGREQGDVSFHPAWHALLKIAVGAGLHCSPWSDPRPGAHVARAAGTYMLAGVESGVYCPVSMTYGAVPALGQSTGIAEEWLPRIFSRTYDPASRPAAEKASALIGMAMTENQGGSDLRANGTRAEPYATEGDRRYYRLTGHKWFMSAPMCDAFLVLAQTKDGPTCFLVPRYAPDGSRNAIHIRRLKDKLGNRSNASSEVELTDAHGELLGEEGRGIPTIIEMGNHTRLDCAIGSSGLMRRALAEATHHAKFRMTFGKRLADHPLMTNVLADLAIESEAATVLTFRLARAYDETDEASATFRRLVTPAAKFWICKRGAAFAAEAMEVLGGNGYVEDFHVARIYREMPVNSIWEGSGNIMCLDVLRALTRTPAAIDVLTEEIRPVASADRRLGQFLARMHETATDDEAHARAFVRDLVIALQAALLIQYAPQIVADGFCASRLGGNTSAFGFLPAGVDTRRIVTRAAPDFS